MIDIIHKTHIRGHLFVYGKPQESSKQSHPSMGGPCTALKSSDAYWERERGVGCLRPSGAPHFTVPLMTIPSYPTPPGHHHNPWLTGTSKTSWVSSSIWILTVISFPEGVGGGFCPRSKVLIPEFSGAPRRDAGVGFCSISPMMKVAYIRSAGIDKRENGIRRRGFSCSVFSLL